MALTQKDIQRIIQEETDAASAKAPPSADNLQSVSEGELRQYIRQQIAGTADAAAGVKSQQAQPPADLSRMTPVQKIAYGLSTERPPVRPQ